MELAYLFGIDNVHDDSTLHHLGQASFDREVCITLRTLTCWTMSIGAGHIVDHVCLMI